MEWEESTLSGRSHRGVGGVNVEWEESSYSQGCALFLLVFWCFKAKNTNKNKLYKKNGTVVGMHDPCHRLNNLILTFLANLKTIKEEKTV